MAKPIVIVEINQAQGIHPDAAAHLRKLFNFDDYHVVILPEGVLKELRVYNAPEIIDAES